jgi:protein-tyrosine phosphatase
MLLVRSCRPSESIDASLVARQSAAERAETSCEITRGSGCDRSDNGCDASFTARTRRRHLLSVASLVMSPTTALSTDQRARVAAVVDHPERHVPFANAFNFRDLGGYDLADGRTTLWGRVFRADGLQRLDDADLDLVDAIGIRTVIDLRTSKEITERGAFPVAKYPVSYHHLSVIDATWTESGVPEFADDEQGGIDFLIWAYRDMLEDGADKFAQAIATLSLPGNGPTVFHCAAGKDRTGLLAALILGGLGVDHEVIAEDYGLTRHSMERMRTWLEANNAEALESMDSRPKHMFGAHPDAMRQILADLDATYGGVRGYLSSIGIGDAVLSDLAARLT